MRCASASQSSKICRTLLFTVY